MSLNKIECINKKGEWFYNFLCNSAIYTLNKYQIIFFYINNIMIILHVYY